MFCWAVFCAPSISPTNILTFVISINSEVGGQISYNNVIDDCLEEGQKDCTVTLEVWSGM